MTIRDFDVKKTVMCQTTPDMKTYTRVQCAVSSIQPSASLILYTWVFDYNVQSVWN